MANSVTHPPLARAALVFIEFQGEWLDADAPLRTRLVKDQNAFERAIMAAERLISAGRNAGMPIVHAGLDLTGDPDYRLFGNRACMENSGLRSTIPRAGTWTGPRAAFREPFAPQPYEFVVKGRSGASVLRNSNLDAYFRNNDIRTIYLCGFATHVCVESTLREAHDLGLDPWIVSDCCAAFTEAQQQHVLEHVVHHFGRTTDSTCLIAAMERLPCFS